jgi:peptidoglycan-N-acetylglucosamine deacetylase
MKYVCCSLGRITRRCLILIVAAISMLAAPVFAQGQAPVKRQTEKRIALTFDDIPRGAGAFFTPDERSEKLIAALKAAGVKQAAFFLNPAKLSEPDGQGGEARISAYVKAGHVIANHSNTHLRLSDSTAEDYLNDIDAAQIWLKGRKGYRPWFRFPYLDEGGADKAKRDAIRAGLKTRGLRNGYVTADGSDWHLEALTITAKNDSKEIDMKALRRLYVTSQMSGVAYHDELARLTIGRSPAHVMLLHETDIAALFIGDFVAELKRNGWTIITADEAFADPIAQVMPDVPYASGTVTGSMAWQKNIDPPYWPLWIGTKMMDDMFQRRVIKKVEEK